MIRRRVRADQYGLAVPPPPLDCMGPECQYGAECYVSRHHLYFPRVKFDGTELLRTFRDDPFNLVAMPRCRHDEEHDRFWETLIPPRSNIEAFLDEAHTLRQLGVSAIRYAQMDLAIKSNDVRQVVRIAYSENPRRFEARRDEQLAEVLELRQAISQYTFELVRPSIVADPVPYATHKHQSARLLEVARAAIAESVAV